MRKNIALLLIICLFFTMLAGCGQNHPPFAEETTPANINEPTEPVEQVEPGQSTEPPQLTEEEEKGNLMPGGYFNELDPKWGVYTESGGDMEMALNPKGWLDINLKKTGSQKHAAQLYCDGFELLENGVYKISFDITSTVARTIEWRVQLNGGDYHAYATVENIAIPAGNMHYEYTFTMEEPSDPAPRFCINMGFHTADGELSSHVITVDNIELFLIDGSKTVSLSDGEAGPGININQVGYALKDSKIAIFRESNLDKNFDVVDVKSGEVVFSGEVKGSVQTPSAGETIALGDFTSVNKPGTYKIVAANSGESYEFTISENPYKNVFEDVLKMFYLQRCGTKLDEGLAEQFAHSACHTAIATIHGSNEKKDVSGGWHDAGDYGRYVVPGAKAAADLILAFEDYPSVFDDNLGIPESKNGIPDVLDEVRYELEWLLKMQNESSGGVYHKVTTLSFGGMIMPQEEQEALFIMPISNCATGDFAAVMAMAARVYEKYDKTFAGKCLSAAKAALSYMESNNNNGGFRNPGDVSTGEYDDQNDADEYFWALSELYKTTGDSSYHNKLKKLNIEALEDGLGWQAVTLYGCYAYLTSNNTDASFKSKVQNKLNSYINNVDNNIKTDGYNSSIGNVYPWGSNMTIANNGMLLLMANKKDLSKTQLDYLLGANSTSYCFVTGYGTLYPNDTHHRPSQALNTTMKGMLIGGANSNLEDPYAQNVLSRKPPAKCYVDNSQSYSCNEITIYWNSPLVYLMAGQMDNHN